MYIESRAQHVGIYLPLDLGHKRSLASPIHTAILSGLVLGCIEADNADFVKVKMKNRNGLLQRKTNRTVNSLQEPCFAL